MTTDNLLFCEQCRCYTRHTFVTNTPICTNCIGENKKVNRFSLLNYFVDLKKICNEFLTSQGLSNRNQGN